MGVHITYIHYYIFYNGKWGRVRERWNITGKEVQPTVETIQFSYMGGIYSVFRFHRMMN